MCIRDSKICVAYDGMEKFFPADKIIMTGNPVRQNLTKDMPSKEEALGSFHLQPGKKTILIVGGSLGARTINNTLTASLTTIKAVSYTHLDVYKRQIHSVISAIRWD